MLPYIGILGLAVPVPALTILAGVWIALDQIEKKAALTSLDKKFVYNLAFNSLLFGLIGARLTFFLFNPNLLLENPLGIISIKPDLMNIPGGVLIGVLFIFITTNRKQIPNLSVLDSLTPGFAVFMILFHLANFFSGNSFGSEVNLPWSIDLWNAMRHPVQIYEMLFAVIIFYIIYPRKHPARRRTGLSFLYFISLSTFSTLIFEAFHGDSQVIFGQIRYVQTAAWLILAFSLWGIIKLKSQQVKVE